MNSLEDSTVLVIGGAGLIGSHVVDELIKEPIKKIVIYDNFTRGSHDNINHALLDKRVEVFPLGGEILQRDILEEAVKEADYVVCLAALWLLHCHEYPESAFQVNVRGNFNVMQACRKYEIKKLVWSSSASVYGDALEIPMTEEHPYNNTTFYGATKIAGEHFLKAFYHRYDLDYAALRYMNVYGARQDYKGTYIAVIMKILDRLDKGQPPIVYGDGSQAYDFIYVSDVARANVCALKSKHSGFYNVGSGTKTSIKELTELILDITGSDQEIEYKPSGQTFVTNRIGSIEKAKKELGFVTKIDLREGLEKVIEWRNNHKELVDRRREQIKDKAEV